MTRVVPLAALLGAALVPNAAHAYSSHEDFGAPVVPEEVPDGGVPTTPGGGGGRYFTGSPADGYTCAVCHTGGETPDDAAFEGLPADGYQPTQTYRLTLTLPDATRSAGAIEVTDGRGFVVGDLQLVPEAEREAADLCTDPEETAAFRTALTDEAGTVTRVVAHVDACGASRLQVDWTAPDADVGPIRIHAVAVGGNGDGRSTPPPDLPDATDSVYAHFDLLPFFGSLPETTRVTTCAAAPGAPAAPLAAVAVLTAAALALRRRR